MSVPVGPFLPPLEISTPKQPFNQQFLIVKADRPAIASVKLIEEHNLLRITFVIKNPNTQLEILHNHQIVASLKAEN